MATVDTTARSVRFKTTTWRDLKKLGDAEVPQLSRPQMIEKLAAEEVKRSVRRQ